MQRVIRRFSKAWFCCALLAGFSLVAGDVLAQARAPRRPNPAMAPIEDTPGLPRVLLIGDSISIGYTLPVRELLAGKANVHRIPMNGGPTTNGLQHLDDWLGDRPWDVIHFNWGLHDLKFINERGQLVPPDEGHVQVPLEDYERNLRQLVARLEKTGARLIWCSTTPVPAGASGRIAGSEAAYNRVALRIMRERGIVIDDLHAFAQPRLADIQMEANVHFTPEGSRLLARQVASSIEEVLRYPPEAVARAESIQLSAPRLPRDQLLVFRGEDQRIEPVTRIDQWELRRREILDGMQYVMGLLPRGSQKQCPLEMRVEEETDQGTYVRRLITYTSEPGSRVPAYLLVPKAVLKDPRREVPAVLCLHGTDNTYGHGVVVGLGNRPNRQYASELAERGFVVLAPNYPLLAKYQPDLAELGWESGTSKAVWDNIRGLDLLESLPFVRPGRFAAMGHSLGGHNSVFTSVFDRRIEAVVSSCGLDSFLDYYDGDEKVWQPEKGWTQTRYMPRLAAFRGRLAEIPFDFHELIGALAPRHVLIIAPRRDHNFRADSVDRIAAAARPVFALYGHPDRLRVEHPDCEHDFPPEMRQAAYEWIASVLGEP